MKTFILAAIAATVLASAVSVQAAERKVPFDGEKFFAEQAARNSSGQ